MVENTGYTIFTSKEVYRIGQTILLTMKEVVIENLLYDIKNV